MITITTTLEENPIRKKLTKKITNPTRIALVSPSFFIVGLNNVNLTPALKIPEIMNTNDTSRTLSLRTVTLKNDNELIMIVNEIV